MMYVSTLLLAVFITEVASGGPTFMIKHKISGKYMHPYYSDVTIPDNDPLVVFQGYSSKIIMTFDIIDDEWGFIRHIDSGKIFVPYWGSVTPDDNTDVVLFQYIDDHPHSKFALDQINNHIIHYGGKYLHPFGDGAYPEDETHVVLHGEVHDRMEWELVNPDDPDEIVYPYGDARIAGEWRLVFSVENPLATHTESISVSIGKSQSESTSSSFKFVWESSASAQFWFAKMSTSSSLSSEIQQSSSDTWTAEITKTDTVEVVSGQSVAVWQKDFFGEQYDHKAFHQSNMFADTEGPHIKPGENSSIKYRFI